MAVADMALPLRSNLAGLLKESTSTTHERLDKAVMDCEPFSNRARFCLFLKVQHAFHREVDPLYNDAAICALMPSIAGSSRLERIEQDLADLGARTPTYASAPLFAANAGIDLPAALGWLYVAEGSNLGAAFLLRQAGTLGLSDIFGARHLAAAPEGRGLRWKTFKNELNAIELAERHEAELVSGAAAAFDRVRAVLDDAFG
ncbi:biliverdin-producing heme oxygenase [Aliihoeflea aestuarii]|jgi:heme oxygenase (biliverdin-IX-beta and delta-forming)|nr:biliverdin-producing heme oxygenase [Aliihoeflea aestuarii]